jgi:ABC-type sugar transport system substrate-binding protein
MNAEHRDRMGWVSAVVVAGGMLLLGCSDSPRSSATSSSDRSSAGGVAAGKRVTICLLPKIKGISYFSSCFRGAQEAAKELGNVDLIYDGPTDGDPKKQAEMIEQWTVDRVDVICVSPNAPDVVANAMKEARAAGIHVITWDADGVDESRAFFVNQATPQSIGQVPIRPQPIRIPGSKS